VTSVPFWNKKPVASQHKAEKIKETDLHLMVILSQTFQKTSEELPSIGHAIDGIATEYRAKMRPLLVQAYQEGLFHVIPLYSPVSGEADYFNILKSIDGEKYQVEKYVKPETALMIELCFNDTFKAKVAGDKTDEVVEKKVFWNDLAVSMTDPAFSRGPSELANCMTLMVQVKYSQKGAYRIMEFNSDTTASDFLETNMRLKKKAIVKVWMENQEKTTGEKRSEESLMNLVEERMITRTRQEGIDFIFERGPSLPNHYEYSIRWKENNRLFNLDTIEVTLKSSTLSPYFIQTFIKNHHRLK
jgi:hypothetical protein